MHAGTMDERPSALLLRTHCQDITKIAANLPRLLIIRKEAVDMSVQVDFMVRRESQSRA